MAQIYGYFLNANGVCVNFISHKHHFATAALGAIGAEDAHAVFLFGSLFAVERQSVAGMGFGHVGYLEAAYLVPAVPVDGP